MEQILFHLDYMHKLYHYYYPDVRQQPYQIYKKPFYTVSVQLPVIPIKFYEY